MPFIGNQPSNNFVSLNRQDITGDGTASYTLDHSVASVNDVLIYVNHVKQDPSSYTISGTSLTMGGTVASTDDFYIIYLGQALQTVTPKDNTITNAMIVDGTIAESKLASGVNTITMAEQYRLTADITTDVNPISSNLEIVDTGGNGSIGTGMTLSSGTFSFPSTGIYLIMVNSTIRGASENSIAVRIRVTTDNSTYNEYASADTGQRNATATNQSASCSAIIDVTDTSQVKVRFQAASIGSGGSVEGNTDVNLTSFTFIRLGDT